MFRGSMLPPLMLLLGTAGALPGPPVRLCAEWEPSFGTLVRWPLGIPSSLVVELARDDSLYVLVENPSQQMEAMGALQSWGVDLGHCRFVTTQTYSHWTRDWGPHWAFDEQGVWGIIDPVFEGYPWIPGGPYRDYTESRGYEEDDQVNAALAEWFGCPLHPFPAFLTGGNFMTDGHGHGFSTLAMLQENVAFMSPSEFLALAGDSLGLESYFITVNPEDYGIQHIDCCAKLLDEETILLKQVPPWHPDYPRLETINDQLTTAISCYGRPYEIVRIQCDPYSGNDVAAYTNSYILNTRVLVPMFGIPSDSQALAVYQEAMPGYEVIGVPYSSWYYYDALHCRTREIMDRQMLLVWHRPLDPSIPPAGSHPVQVMVHAYSGAPLIDDSLSVVWRTDGGAWQSAPLLPAGPDSLEGAIPGQPDGSLVDYYIVAADESGRRETHPRSAPEGFHRFLVTSTGAPPGQGVTGLRIHPNPARGVVAVELTLQLPVKVEFRVYDLSGRMLHESGGTVLPSGANLLSWEPDGHPPGCYRVLVRAGDELLRGSVVLLD